MTSFFVLRGYQTARNLIMHAGRVLQKILHSVTAHVDARNVRTLLLAVEALLAGRRLTLMELARYFPGAEHIGAPLKRLDRLLSNRAVQTVRAPCYQVALAWLLRSARPVLVVDWSELKSDGRWHLLRAGVVCRGRTLTVYEEVHPETRKNSPKVEAKFLQRLNSLLPEEICPIILTDAGFRVPWFRAVESLGWHWVGRVRHRTRLRLLDAPQRAEDWISCQTLHPQATPKACALGEVVFTRSNPLHCRLTLVRRARRGRVERTRYGTRAEGGHSRKMARCAREPWLLACSCSLQELSAAEIVRLYAKRMQIEQSFRDLKSHRYGCAFEDTLTRDPRRLEMLLLIHALANLVAWLAGLAVLTESVIQAGAKGRAPRHSIVWIGWEHLRRTSARLSLPLSSAAQRLRSILAQTI
jgi:hypothetical protein